MFSSVAHSCLTLWDPRDYNTPDFPVHYQLTEFTQIHVHWVGDRQGSFVYCSPWGLKELDMNERLNWTSHPLPSLYSTSQLNRRDLSFWYTSQSSYHCSSVSRSLECLPYPPPSLFWVIEILPIFPGLSQISMKSFLTLSNRRDLSILWVPPMGTLYLLFGAYPILQLFVCLSFLSY